MKGHIIFQRGDNSEIAKIHWRNFCFSRTTWPISTKLSTKHPLMMEIQVYSKEGPYPFQREDSKNTLTNFKIFISRTTWLISIKLNAKYPWLKGIQVCSNKWSCTFSRRDNYEIVKIHWQNLKSSSQNHGTNFHQIWHKASFGEGDSSLFKWRTIQFSKVDNVLCFFISS